MDNLVQLRAREPFPLPVHLESRCKIVDLTSRPRVGQPVTFHLRKKRGKTEIQVTWQDPLVPNELISWSLSQQYDYWPNKFEEARKYAVSYFARYGYGAVETGRKVGNRSKRPKGTERDLIKSGKCRESWLSSEVPVLWAEAMVRCQHPAGYCGHDGYCIYGDCDMELDVNLNPEVANEEP